MQFRELQWRWRRLVLNVRLFILDIIGMAIATYNVIARALAATFTVKWDPLDRSNVPIPLYMGRRTDPLLRNPIAFTVFSTDFLHNERHRRIVAWYYRWHEVPDLASWKACLSRFDLKYIPPHTLKIISKEGTQGNYLEVRIRHDSNTRSAMFFVDDTLKKNTLLDSYAPSPRAGISGKIPIGGLTSERLIANAFKGWKSMHHAWLPVHKK